MIGTVVSHYRIVEKIGEGGMGEVYRAEDKHLPRSVAIKLLPERAGASAERRARFLREAQAASSLNHPGIVHVYDIEEADGRLFIVMEYVSGRTVAQLLAGGPLPLDEILRIAIEAGEALAAAHAAGIVHRDVKPSNVIVADGGYVKIFDFGLAKLLGGIERTTVPDEASTRAPNLTRHGQLIGTVLYMSPELALGEPVDRRSDVFSFGALLYEMSTGKLPFSGASEIAVIEKVIHGEPQPIGQVNPDIPESLERIVSKAMEKKPDNRYQSMTDLLVDLRSLRRSLEADSAAPGALVRGARSAGRRGAPAVRTALWGAFALTLAIAAAVLIDRGNDGLARADDRVSRSIAVMPFDNAGGDPDSKYLSDGIRDGIVVDLLRIAGLKVVAPESTSSLKSSGDPQAIGRRYGVESILTGSVRRDGGIVRVHATLQDARRSMVLWGDRIDRPMAGLFDVQDEVSHQIANALSIRLTRGEKAEMARTPTTNARAYDLCLRGRELTTRRTPSDLRRAVELFDKALALDGGNAQAWSGLADAFSVAAMFGWDLGDDATRRADEASRKAIALDPTLIEAHLSRGVVAGLEGDLDGGISRIQHAISLAPDSARSHHWLAVLYKLRGRFGRAQAEDDLALQLDPDMIPAHLNLAHIAILEDEPDAAVARLSPLLKARPDEPLVRVLLSWALLRRGEASEALDHLDAARTVAPEDPLVAGMRGMALAALGRSAGARAEAERVSELTSTRPYPLAEYAAACIHALLGSRTEALDHLEKALRTRALSVNSIISAAYVLNDPILASLRSDPRFKSLAASL